MGREWIVCGRYGRWPIDEFLRGEMQSPDILPAASGISRKQRAELIAGKLNRAYRLGTTYGRYGTDTPDDWDRIVYACEKAAAYGEDISDACARMIGAQLHEGQMSASYAFASTGAIVGDPKALWRELFSHDSLVDMDARVESGEVPRKTRLVATCMLRYLLGRRNASQTGPIDGWPKLRLND